MIGAFVAEPNERSGFAKLGILNGNLFVRFTQLVLSFGDHFDNFITELAVSFRQIAIVTCDDGIHDSLANFRIRAFKANLDQRSACVTTPLAEQISAPEI